MFLSILAAAALSAPSPVCVDLSAQYEHASKRLAFSPEQSAEIMAGAQMTMTLMQTNGCPLPTAAPSPERYIVKAGACRVAQLRVRLDMMRGGRPYLPQECLLSGW